MKAFLFLLRLGAVLLAALLAGCASMPRATTRDVVPLFQDTLFQRPAEPINRRAVFALDPAMRRFVAKEIAPLARRKDPRYALMEVLNGKLHINYDSQMTRTASQTFATREGNCLSLVIMAGALARRLGIPVVYQQVYDLSTWSRDAGFAILGRHVNLVLSPRPRGPGHREVDTTRMIVDFLPPKQAARVVSRPVSQQTIVAMYMNNRAAEVMVGGDLDRAYWFARTALEIDPGYANAANTLGVIYGKRNFPAAAERALRYALEREPDNVAALSNFAGLLTTQGHITEARKLRKRLARIQRHPPFYFYDQGMQAMHAGHFEEAARLFGKALALRPYDVPSHFELAKAAAHLGDVRRARKQLELAMENSTTPAARAIYAAKLRHLQSLN